MSIDVRRLVVVRVLGKGRSNQRLPEVEIDTPLRKIAGACANIVHRTKTGIGPRPETLRLNSSRERFCFCDMFQRHGSRGLFNIEASHGYADPAVATTGLIRLSIGRSASFAAGTEAFLIRCDAI